MTGSATEDPRACRLKVADRCRKAAEDRLPRLHEDIRHNVDGQCQADPKFQTNGHFTRICAEKCEEWVRHLPDLRIIDDALWDAAQARLAVVGGARRGQRRSTGQLAGSAP